MYLLVTQDGATSRTRYYERATMLIKRAVLMLMLFPYLVKTDKMIADMFTKALDKQGIIHEVPRRGGEQPSVAARGSRCSGEHIARLQCTRGQASPTTAMTPGRGHSSRRERCIPMYTRGNPVWEYRNSCPG